MPSVPTRTCHIIPSRPWWDSESDPATEAVNPLPDLTDYASNPLLVEDADGGFMYQEAGPIVDTATQMEGAVDT